MARAVKTSTAPAKKTEQLARDSNAKLTELERERKSLAQKYKDEDRVTVSGSPFYRPHFGVNMPISLNGIPIYVPLDGHQYSIPVSYARVFHERIAAVDRRERSRKQMADTQANLETYAGELDLVHAL